MIIAEQVQITMVSTNTPNACRSPAFGRMRDAAAAAAAQGAEPEPASFEKSPRFTPFISTAPKPPRRHLAQPECLGKNPLKYSRKLADISHDHKIVIRK